MQYARGLQADFVKTLSHRHDPARAMVFQCQHAAHALPQARQRPVAHGVGGGWLAAVSISHAPWQHLASVVKALQP